MDSLAALEIAERSLTTGPPNKSRVLMAKLALSLCMSKQLQNCWDSGDQYSFRMLIRRIEYISELKNYIQQFNDPTFLYWHQAIVWANLQQSFKDRDLSSFKVRDMSFLIEFI